MDGSFNKPVVVGVIPCYNEENFIYQLVATVLAHVDVVLVINDGSQDNTEKEAALAGAKVITHSCNLGKGAALSTALSYLRSRDFSVMVLLDGDGQHAPEDIEQVIAPVLAGKADLVIGSRYLESAHRIPLYRKLGQRVLNIVTNLGSGIDVSDSQSGFRAFSKTAVKLMEPREKGFAVESEMQFIAAKAGLRVVEVPITTIYQAPVKRNPVAHGFAVLFRLFVLIHAAGGLPAVLSRLLRQK
ncbi:MAG TPA: glycosyltransferase family 2 protein [Bacillota bacterium]|nr:glycosyltransferase family 2 protein [Bacillota bacterium]